jgi:hypothetical protein
VWSYPFRTGEAKLTSPGFANFHTTNSNTPSDFQIPVHPQRIFEVIKLAGIQTNTAYIGPEYCFLAP